MIRVKLVRSGVHSKYFKRNSACNGAFYKNFKSIEDLVLYFRTQYGSIYFAPDFHLSEENMRIFRSKYQALARNKHMTQVDAKIDKEIERRRHACNLYL